MAKTVIITTRPGYEPGIAARREEMVQATFKGGARGTIFCATSPTHLNILAQNLTMACKTFEKKPQHLVGLCPRFFGAAQPVPSSVREVCQNECEEVGAEGNSPREIVKAIREREHHQ
jgi:hypothetical protein